MAYNRTGIYKGNTELGKLLRRVRKARKYTLKQVAQAVNKTPQYIWDIENGKRGSNLNPLLAVQLAEFLKIPITTLFPIAGIENDLTSKKYLEVLKLTRNKGRAARIQHALDGVVQTTEDILSGTESGTLLEAICQKLKSFVDELETAIRTA